MILFRHSALWHCTVLSLLSINAFSTEKPLSYHDIINHPSGVCEFLKSKTSVAKYRCQDCQSFINSHADKPVINIIQDHYDLNSCELTHSALDQNSGWAIYIDNDLLTLDSWTGLNDDRNYTMGIGGATFGEQNRTGWMATSRNWIDGVFSIFSSSEHYLVENHSKQFGVTAFTPNELENSEPIAGDRPYASILYLSNAQTRAYNSNYAIRTEWAVGFLGLDIAKATQRFLHNKAGVSSQDPLGWDNQISEGGEPTLLYAINRIGLLEDSKHLDLSYTTGLNMGYYTDAQAGLNLRLGRISSPYFTLNDNPLSKYNHFHGKQNDNYLFLTYKLRAVAYNALLQGQLRHSEVTFSGLEIERVLHEASIGWAYGMTDTWQLTYSINYKSKEFEGSMAREHWFAGIYLTKTFPSGK